MDMRRLLLLLASVATILAAPAAQAADAVVLAEPEPVEYVRVCDAYGAGFFYIPGTETCLKIGGYLRFDLEGGDDVYTGGHAGGENDTWYNRTRAEVRFDARSETELGTLRSYIDTRLQFTNGSSSDGILHQAYIELGGFQIGINDVLYGSFLGYAGSSIINDDVIQYGSDSISTNLISYTFTGGNGFSAIIAAEQGEVFDDTDYIIDDYMPHVLAGAKLEQQWGKIGAVIGYDSVQESIGVKARLDVDLTESISAWVMGGYQSDYDPDSFVTKENRSWYGLWEGDWAAWGGFAAKLTEKATLNGQAAYESEGTWALALNINYEIVKGFTVRPELNYTKFGGARKEEAIDLSGEDDAIGGIVRFQRNF